MSTLWNCKVDGHRVEYMVLYSTREVIAFKPIPKDEHRRIATMHGRVCYSLVWFSGVEAFLGDDYLTLRCGHSELKLYQPCRNALDSLLRRFRSLGEQFTLNVYRL